MNTIYNEKKNFFLFSWSHICLNFCLNVTLIFLIIKFGFITVFNKIKFERINKQKELEKMYVSQSTKWFQQNKNIRPVAIKIVFNVSHNYKIVMLYHLTGHLWQGYWCSKGTSLPCKKSNFCKHKTYSLF